MSLHDGIPIHCSLDVILEGKVSSVVLVDRYQINSSFQLLTLTITGRIKATSNPDAETLFLARRNKEESSTKAPKGAPCLDQEEGKSKVPPRAV